MMNSKIPYIFCRDPVNIKFIENQITQGSNFCFKDGGKIIGLKFQGDQLYIGNISANSFFRKIIKQKTVRWLDHLYLVYRGERILVKTLLIPDKEVNKRNKISACEKGSQWQEALRLLEEMKENNIAPNTVTYNAVISACQKASQWQEVLRLFEEMKENNITPDTITFSAAISACEFSKKTEH